MLDAHNHKSLKQKTKNGLERGEEVIQKALRLSDLYYNEGLKKANVRDLSGAITMLKNSLRFNKGNTNARNLLGLIYNEMGDTATALSEWVISRHFQEEENEAEYYLSHFQSNPTRLNKANQIVKKYNFALKSLRSDGADIAMIQLKKIINLCPHHVKALQLLGLLHIKNEKYAEARKFLISAKEVDICNTLTLYYLEELQLLDVAMERPKEVKVERVLFADSDSFAPASSYKEDKPSVLPWINLVIGIALGAAFFAIAMLPGIKEKSVESKMAEITSLNESLAESNADISQLESKNEELSKTIENLERKNKQLAGKEEEGKKEEGVYLKAIFEASTLFLAGDEKKTAETLLPLKKDEIKDKAALDLYSQLVEKVFPKQAKLAFSEGRSWYNKGRFDKALPKFEEAFVMNPGDVETVYLTARSYDRLGEKEKAKEWYNRVISDFPTTYRVNDAKLKLRLLGGE